MQQGQGSTIAKIAVRENKEHNLLTDPASPWASAPESVKALFEADGNKVKFNKIENITTLFETKEGTTNFCSKFFPAGGSYYTCSDCCFNGGGTTMCFCERCWDPERHVGHNFRRDQAWGSSAYCDCGRTHRIKPESFCPYHGSSQILSIEIAEEDRKKFVQFFEPLLLIYLYLNANGDACRSDVGKNINEIVIVLSEYSLHYIRLFSSIFEKSVLLGNSKKEEAETTILLAYMEFNDSCEKMFFRLTCDFSFLLTIAKAFIIKPRQMGQLKKDIFEMEWVLFKLAEEDIFTEDERAYLRMANQDSEISKKTFIAYMNHLKKKETSQEFFKSIVKILTDKDLKVQILDKQTKQSFLNSIFESYNSSEDIDELLQRKRIQSIAVLLASFYDKKIQDLKDIRSHLEQLQITPEQLDKYVQEGCVKAKDIIYRPGDDRNSYLIIPILALLLEAPNKAELMEKFWISLSQENDGLREDFIETVDVVYHLISLVAHHKNNFCNDKEELKEEDELEKEKWFKEFLYENQKIDKDELLKMKKSKKLSFKNAGKIIRNYCRYDENNDTFHYTSKEAYPNFLLRFKVRSRRGNFRAIPHSHFNINQQFYSSSPMHDQIYELIFANDFMSQTFCKVWKEKVEKHKDDDSVTGFWKNYELSFFYTLMLVCGHTLCHGKSKSILQELNNIRKDPDTLALYSSFNSTPTLLENLLCINKEEEKKVEEEKTEEEKVESPVKPKAEETKEPEQESVKKQKFLEKKEKMYKKLKEKREMVLERNPSKTGRANEEEESEQETCLLCHETTKKDKEMVYLAKLVKDETLANSFHGQEDKAGISIETCRHPVHSRCFMGIDKNSSMEFSCPLCSKKSNIFLPINISNPVTLKQCENIINALHVVKFKSLDFTSIFPLLYRHLIESYGLGSLINLVDFAKEKTRKRANDELILEVACSFYENMSEAAQAQATQAHHEFLASIVACENEIIKELQRILAVIIYERIALGVASYEEKELMNLKEKMDEDEFEILQESIEFLVDSKIELPEIPASDPPVEKKSLSFKVKRLPDSAKDLGKFGKEMCSACQKNPRQTMCLLCGDVFCGCDGLAKHKSFHNGNVILFSYANGRVTVDKKSQRANSSVYFDPFMISYDNKEKGEDDSNFELSSAKFEKIVQVFFQIQ